MSVPNENVLVIRRELLDQLGSFHGLNFEPRKYLGAFLSRGNNFFLPRAEAEINPAYKQIIPYALIAFQNKVAYYVRGKKAGEQRLVAKGSIGIGGHMNETDESLFAVDEQAYRTGVEREVNEEIKIDAPFDDRIVALLNDDTTEVGKPWRLGRRFVSIRSTAYCCNRSCSRFPVGSAWLTSVSLQLPV